MNMYTYLDQFEPCFCDSSPAEAPPARRALPPRPAVVVAAPRRSDWRRPLPGLGIPEAQDFRMMMVDG